MRRRLRALFTWQVAAPIVAYVLSALLVVSVIEAFLARNEAIDARNRTATAASRRIDLLNAEIVRLQHRLQQDARERGRLEEAIKLLAQQVRRMGGNPVETVHPQTSPTTYTSPSPRPASSPHPSPHPTPTHHPSPSPTPTPSPSPTCSLQDLLHHPANCLHLI